MEARAIQRGVRQSARKMRLVIDLIRGRIVPEADAILRFSKKRAAKQIRKVLKSAVANAQQKALRAQEPLDVDRLRVRYAIVNEGATLKRFGSAAMGRATPIMKRTSPVEIRVGPDAAPGPKTPAGSPAAKAATGKRAQGTKAAAAAPPKRSKRRASGSKGSK